MIKLTTSLLAIILAAAVSHNGALAQTATETECATALETLNTQITGVQGATTGQREEASTLSEQASNAQDAGDYARCVELTGQAMSVMTAQQ